MTAAEKSLNNRSIFRAGPRWLLAIALLFGGMHAAIAVDPPEGWKPRSGDAWMDRQLEDINSYAERYREAFIDELVRYQGTPRDLAQEMLGQHGWKPGDLYYACAVAQTIGQPCRNVVAEWTRDHEDGWLGVGKRMGLTQAQFRELKRGVVSSYDRWGRPIVLDAQLRKALPERADATASAPADSRAQRR